ncbi:MAG: LCP family protein [Ruminococcus sp.]|nr:LCP family protein [Ruminococcus sp.]
MAGNRGKSHSEYVDISSNTQVVSLYKKKGRVKRAVSLVLAIIFMITGAGMLYVYNALDSIVYDSEVVETTAATEATKESVDDPGDFKTAVTDTDLLTNSKVLNVMLFGEDNHSKGSTGRSDSMIMASIDNNSKRIKLTSFQRDTYVYIPGHGYGKINSSYSLGGASLAIRTIEANFGVKVDRYAVVDFTSFRKIIDILGGLTINLDHDEVAYINWQMYINHQTTERYLLDEKDGKITLTGQQALWYARDRGYDGVQSGDDWDRTDRQRKLLETVFNSMRDASITQIVQIVSEIGPHVTTNLKKDEITGLLSHSLTYMKYKVKKYSVPQDGLWSYFSDPVVGSCIQINDMEKCRQKFAKFVFGNLIETT